MLKMFEGCFSAVLCNWLLNLLYVILLQLCFVEVSASFLLDVWSYDKMLHRKRQRTSHRVYQKEELPRQIHMLRVWGKCL